jgi:hypothetical protein
VGADRGGEGLPHLRATALVREADAAVGAITPPERQAHMLVAVAGTVLAVTGDRLLARRLAQGVGNRIVPPARPIWCRRLSA